MCWTLMPAASFSRSAAQCEAEPSPAEAKFNAPGFALAAATRSVTDFQPFEGAATNTLGCTPNSATGTKSCSGSQGSVLYSATAEPCEDVNSRMVYPSGSALATEADPIVPPAPVRFSMTKDWPICFDI